MFISSLVLTPYAAAVQFPSENVEKSDFLEEYKLIFPTFLDLPIYDFTPEVFPVYLALVPQFLIEYPHRPPA
jgi:hypothetical protein